MFHVEQRENFAGLRRGLFHVEQMIVDPSLKKSKFSLLCVFNRKNLFLLNEHIQKC